jgi:hypothetical protein
MHGARQRATSGFTAGGLAIKFCDPFERRDYIIQNAELQAVIVPQQA